MMTMSRGLKLRSCSKRKKSDDCDDGLLLSPLREKNKKTISPARFFRLGRLFLKAKKRASKKKSKAAAAAAGVQEIKKGDVVDISTLLFTKRRNYLLKGDNQWVQAKKLDVKVIVLYFMNLVSGRDDWMQETTCLVDIYNEM
ncbi:hypothetical protein AgCh_003084 [Apium graveolens]